MLKVKEFVDRIYIRQQRSALGGISSCFKLRASSQAVVPSLWGPYLLIMRWRRVLLGDYPLVNEAKHGAY